MRCPFCGMFNRDDAAYCTRCGRDLVPGYPPGQTTQGQPPRRPAGPNYAPPANRQQAPRPPSVPPIQAGPVRSGPGSRAKTVPEPPRAFKGQEAPQSFPPHTTAQLKELESLALPYTRISDEESNGHKKIVRIQYQACPAWNQVATLWKALNDVKDDNFATTLIQGFTQPGRALYSFNNGQLQFDHGVLLGSQRINRYIFDTGSGFEGDAVRIVLSE
ncbi:hypothetical protein EPA93_36825 [Ktedonosporobacter rubrisoli]|uniref:Zinc ribbon domain-containing protein n=1 Tax=Ktedonosporobacter rubrisoli TaxID=2509675 RepID=A0A4P6K1C8_KTERU|nr:hypothetical protein [Ktedonosporobacter rubrisoli]QBD81246.1 hypothetical protein EPA93_36825 [Ktedonosporobacter rubrisoli]